VCRFHIFKQSERNLSIRSARNLSFNPLIPVSFNFSQLHSHASIANATAITLALHPLTSESVRVVIFATRTNNPVDSLNYPHAHILHRKHKVCVLVRVEDHESLPGNVSQAEQVKSARSPRYNFPREFSRTRDGVWEGLRKVVANSANLSGRMTDRKDSRTRGSRARQPARYFGIRKRNSQFHERPRSIM